MQPPDPFGGYFRGRVAVIVGAGPGLGATLGARFAAAGALVALVARTTKSLQLAAGAVVDAGGQPLPITADIASPADAKRVADTVLAQFGRVDVLVNAAFGAGPKRALLDMDDADLEHWRKTVEVGGYGTLLACRFFAPAMMARRSGAIVNVTSMSSRIGLAGRSDYAAGKAQAHKIAHALADELGPSGIRVNCVAPGHIWSEQLEKFYRWEADREATTYEAVLAKYTAEMALRRIVTADEIANAVLFLASEMASGITGALLDVNAGHLFTP
ncbi:MAG TPA: SDR family oxidoreductase [Trebonia sp.]|nr:SDR family oxidoreductase [Trebonia sp.]